MVTADWTLRVPVRVCAASGCSVAPLCPVTLNWNGKKVMPPLALAIPAEVRGQCLSSSFIFHIQLSVFSLTLHRYGDCLPVVGGHGDHSLPGWDGRDDAGLVGLGHGGRCCTGGAGGGDSRLAVQRVNKQTAASHAGGRRAVAVQQGGGGGGHTWRGETGGMLFYIQVFLINSSHIYTQRVYTDTLAGGK